ncbi:type IV secretion system protein [Nitrosovibrio sp. Nv6]|uniref:type IV secretion system protein n=1 Tax=Nitrosovibrio sp. Nv6 TaxID=1855340 RepID=UPI0008D06780|nr:type IV secretion system protein [Nitrosovibrio sp. Nv6]SEP43202.1 Type IV secretory pathway, component VirB8 [Nitrosovibrio sp. Nv6]
MAEIAKHSIPWITAQRAAAMLGWVSIILACALVGMVAWHVTNPVKVIEPVYIEFQSSGNTVARIERVGDSITRRAVVVGAESRRYVVDRETVDKVTESVRYPRVFAMSGPALAAAFRNQYGGKDGLLQREGFKREVEVTRDSTLGEGIHQVEIITRDTDKMKPAPVIQHWVVTLTYDFHDQQASYDDGLLNPLGFVVSEYTISRRATK